MRFILGRANRGKRSKGNRVREMRNHKRGAAVHTSQFRLINRGRVRSVRCVVEMSRIRRFLTFAKESKVNVGVVPVGSMSLAYDCEICNYNQCQQKPRHPKNYST